MIRINSGLFNSLFALIGAFFILLPTVPELCKGLINYNNKRNRTMFNFFRKHKTNTHIQQSTHVAPGTQIHYLDHLIDDLQGDHKVLLNIFGKIQNEFNKGRYNEVTVQLKQFRRAITDHLLVENIQLYIYLSHEFAQDEVTTDLVKEFKREMNQISKVVIAFLTKYEAIGVDKQLASTFAKDLTAIGAALVERIEREEHTLYPLYMSSY
jgi:regulator of sigma D